jgi:hypothetical protein
VEYEIDKEDEDFINEHASLRSIQNIEDAIEIAFDYFEKESFFSV